MNNYVNHCFGSRQSQTGVSNSKPLRKFLPPVSAIESAISQHYGFSNDCPRIYWVENYRSAIAVKPNETVIIDPDSNWSSIKPTRFTQQIFSTYKMPVTDKIVEIHNPWNTFNIQNPTLVKDGLKDNLNQKLVSLL